MKKRFTEFMRGRYGADELSRFMLGVCLLLMLVTMIIRIPLLYLVALALLGVCYFRMFSRDFAKRSAENQKYRNIVAKVETFVSRKKRRAAQSKEYHIYKCPSCGQKIRIPRGKGKICITCPKCKHQFNKKS